MSELELSIVIPCLNEAKTLPLVLGKCFAALKKMNLTGEVIVADNGSTDESVKIATHHGARVVHVQEKGYGNALRTGMEAAQGKYILMGDADDSYNFEEIEPFITAMKEGNDLAIGSRLKGHIEEGAMPGLHRYLGTPVLTFLVNLLFKTRISDCNCGMRSFTKKAFEAMKLHSPGMEFASEMIMKAGLLKLKIKEFPINFYRDKRGRRPHLKTWSDGWRHLTFMFFYSPKYLFMVPGAFMMIAGLAILIPLLNGPIHLFGKTFSYHSATLGGLLTVLGYQILSTGMYAKSYALTQDFKIHDPLIEKFYKHFSLGKGVILGLLIFLVGFAIDFAVVLEWINKGYQNLERAEIVTAASTLIIIGVQTIFSSFFLSLLKLHRKA